eukprot:2886092-Prymnesium_polylepis.3
MAQLQDERAKQEGEIERAKAEAKRLAAFEEEAKAARLAKEAREAELNAMKEQIAKMAEDAELRRLEALAAQGGPEGKLAQAGSGSMMFEPVPVMIKQAAARLERAGKAAKKGDLQAVQRVIETLPVLTACNDLRALTELDGANRSLFQSLGGIRRLIEYLAPNGPQAPYATHVARTLPCVMDGDARTLFHEYAALQDRDGVVRYKYLSALLESADPDDREHACLAIASVAQDSPTNRKAFHEHAISTQVLNVLQESCRAQVPRQRLQRVVVLALSELAHDFEPFKNSLREAEGVPMLLQMLTPSNDPFVIKETLQLVGRITQGHAGIQHDLQRYAGFGDPRPPPQPAPPFRL